MERTVPTTESEEVDLYIRTYYSLLRSTAEVQIRTLEEAHAGMNSLLHPDARGPDLDMSAFLYSILRLPDCMPYVELVVLGQSEEVFAQAGMADISNWREVSALARRRKCYFNGIDLLACFIASRSDIDDIVPLLTAYQIEWNKLHRLLGRIPGSISIKDICDDVSGSTRLAALLGIAVEDTDRLFAVWDRSTGENLGRIASFRRRTRVQLLSGSLSAYRRATHAWWGNIETQAPILAQRPVYMVSSNTHSLLNLLSGYPRLHWDELLDYLKQPGNAGLLYEWQDIQAGVVPSDPENFLYYVYRKYQDTPQGVNASRGRRDHDLKLGIQRIHSTRSFDVEAQVFKIGDIDPEFIDPRLRELDTWDDVLLHSDAIILNIDYPLGMGAYHLCSEIAEHVGEVLGVYVMGKSASLNGVVGDVLIPNVVHDEHSQNTYLFPNCFSAGDVVPYLVYGTVLDNQKAVTVQGTFLQNAEYMDVFYREGYTDIEMEAGPYLSAAYEMYRPKRHPVNEIVNLHGVPFDLGILHYASDTPLSKGKNLGAGSLSYYGMDSTYAASLAVLRRIFNVEKSRIQNRRKPRG